MTIWTGQLTESVSGLLIGSYEVILEQTEPGDDIDEDLVTIRIQEPEVSSKDLGMRFQIQDRICK